MKIVNLCRADKFLLGGAASVAASAAVFGATPLGIGVPVAGIMALMLDGIFRPSSSMFYPTLCHGPRDRPAVALTFDDGPDAEVTPRILDLLGEFQARASFFVIGRNLERNRSLGKRLLSEGHELGNHSWQHSYFHNFYGMSAHEADMRRNAYLIQELSGSAREPLYRPPVGLKSPALARVAHARGLRIVAWSLHSRDTFSRHPHKTAARILSRVKPGDIVLMHDGHEIEGRRRRAALEALPVVLAGLRERGLQCVTASDLLYR